MRVVVTGATGQVGRALLAQLAEHAPVAVVRPGSKRPPLEVECVELDLDSAWSPGTRALPERCDAVVYLAQSNTYRDLPAHAGSLFRVNVASVASMLEYARAAGATHFVLASSGSVYLPSAEPLRESSPLICAGSDGQLYAWSRRSAEELVASYRAHFVTSVLRLFFVYGVGAKPDTLVPAVVERVRRGAAVTLQGHDGLVITPTWAGDAAAACRAALSREGPGVFNVAGPEAVSLRELALTAGEVFAREPRFEQGAGVPAQFRVSIDAMREELGVRPRDLRTGLRQLAANAARG